MSSTVRSKAPARGGAAGASASSAKKGAAKKGSKKGSKKGAKKGAKKGSKKGATAAVPTGGGASRGTAPRPGGVATSAKPPSSKQGVKKSASKKPASKKGAKAKGPAKKGGKKKGSKKPTSTGGRPVVKNPAPSKETKVEENSSSAKVPKVGSLVSRLTQSLVSNEDKAVEKKYVPPEFAVKGYKPPPLSARLSSAAADLCEQMAGPKRGAMPADLPRWCFLTLDAESVFQLEAHGTEHEADAVQAVVSRFDPSQVYYILINPTRLDATSPKVMELLWLGKDALPVERALSQERRKDLEKLCYKYFTLKAIMEIVSPEECTLEKIKWAMLGIKGGGTVSKEQAFRDDAAATALRFAAAAAANAPASLPDELTPEEQEARAQRELEAKENLARMKAEGIERFALAQGGYLEMRFKHPKTGELSRDTLIENLQSGIRKVKTGTEWLVIGIKLPATAWLDAMGAEGALTEEWREKWLDDSAIRLLVFNLQSTAGGYGMKTYTMVVRWVGEAVSIKHAAAANQFFPALVHFTRETLGSLTGEIEARKKEEVEVDLILEKITGTKLRAQEIELPPKDELFKSFGRQPEELVFTNNTEMLTSIKELGKEYKGQSDCLLWQLVTYEPGEICKMRLSQEERADTSHDFTGSVSLTFSSHFLPDNICFVLFRGLFIPPQFASVPLPKRLIYARSEYGLYLWQGMEISVMAKALSSYHWKEWSELVKSTLEPLGVVLHRGYCAARTLSEISQQNVRERLGLR
eukprot:gb/GEZN01002901.1/.p1 GENE.gb/GEZN01002901.1/~~gb/GEZN01002901.1/.p1  ORF type:complete len:752 (+),score=120.48 gb/GEZN01002901.1/:38-2293(+)